MHSGAGRFDINAESFFDKGKVGVIRAASIRARLA